MPVRTNPGAVREVLLRDYDSKNNPDLTVFIETASVIVDHIAETASGYNTPYSTLMLEMIERWLTAHFYTQADPSYTSRSTLGASGSFTGVFALGLDNSRYGQQVRLLDYRRILDAMTQTAPAEAEGYYGGMK